MRNHLLAVGMALVVGSWTVSSWAQTEEERAGARAAAVAGAEAFSAGQWQQAVDLFERAESLVHAPPHLVYLARANAKLGRLVTARELYNEVVREKLGADAPEAFVSAQREAAAELQAIEPRLARLTVTVRAPEGVTPEVTMDGQAVPTALVGIPRPVDPGEHVLEAAAPGYRSEPKSVTLDEGGTATLELQLVSDPSTAPPPEAAGGAAPPLASSPSPSAPSDAGTAGGVNGMRIGSYIALGVGAVGVGLGSVFGVRSIGKRSDADDLDAEFRDDCGDVCLRTDPRAAEIDDLDDQARSAKTIATVGFVLGGVGLATGATLFVLSGGHGEQARATPRVRGWVGLGSVGVAGSF